MFKIFVLCFAILSLICAIHCTPTAVKRGRPSPAPKRDGLVARSRPSPAPKRDGIVARGRPSPAPKREVARDHRPSPVPKRNVARDRRPSPVPKRNVARDSRPSPVPKRNVARDSRPSPVPKREVARDHRPSPVPKRDGLVARGHCDFLCPQDNLVGGAVLSQMYTDFRHLYCGYDVEDMNALCMYNRNTGELVSSSSLFECDQQAAFQCSGTKNDQEGMKLSPDQPRDSRAVNLPQFVKARSEARRAVDADTV